MMLIGAAAGAAAFGESTAETAGDSLPWALVCFGADFLGSLAAVFFPAAGADFADLLALVWGFF